MTAIVPVRVPSVHDIVVSMVGSRVQAIDKNGVVVSSGSSAATVLQAAIDSLKGLGVGGTVAFRGNLSLTSGITLYPGIGLVGQGPLSAGDLGANVLSATTAVTGPIITVVNDTGNPTWTYFPFLSNFTLFGTHPQTGQDGIYISDANGTILDVFIQNVEVFDVGGHGINISNAGKHWFDNLYLEHCQKNGIRQSLGTLRVTNTYFFGNALYGIDATSSGQCSALNNLFRSNVSGSVLFWSMGTCAQLLGNYLEDNGTTAGVFSMRCQSISGSARAQISDNNFRDTRGGSAVVNFIDTDNSGATIAVITGNTFTGMSGPAIRLRNNNSGSKKIIRSNMGFNDTLGQLTTPMQTANGTIGMIGATSTAVASTDYRVNDVDQYVVIANDGTGVSITIKDAAGNTVQSALTSFAGFLPIGFKINFGAFSVAPTVASYAA